MANYDPRIEGPQRFSPLPEQNSDISEVKGSTYMPGKKIRSNQRGFQDTGTPEAVRALKDPTSRVMKSKGRGSGLLTRLRLGNRGKSYKVGIAAISLPQVPEDTPHSARTSSKDLSNSPISRELDKRALIRKKNYIFRAVPRLLNHQSDDRDVLLVKDNGNDVSRPQSSYDEHVYNSRRILLSSKGDNMQAATLIRGILEDDLEGIIVFSDRIIKSPTEKECEKLGLEEMEELYESKFQEALDCYKGERTIAANQAEREFIALETDTLAQEALAKSSPLYIDLGTNPPIAPEITYTRGEKGIGEKVRNRIPNYLSPPGSREAATLTMENLDAIVSGFDEEDSRMFYYTVINAIRQDTKFVDRNGTPIEKETGQSEMDFAQKILQIYFEDKVISSEMALYDVIHDKAKSSSSRFSPLKIPENQDQDPAGHLNADEVARALSAFPGSAAKYFSENP